MHRKTELRLHGHVHSWILLAFVGWTLQNIILHISKQINIFILFCEFVLYLCNLVISRTQLRLLQNKAQGSLKTESGAQTALLFSFPLRKQNMKRICIFSFPPRQSRSWHRAEASLLSFLPLGQKLHHIGSLILAASSKNYFCTGIRRRAVLCLHSSGLPILLLSWCWAWHVRTAAVAQRQTVSTGVEGRPFGICFFFFNFKL